MFIASFTRSAWKRKIPFLEKKLKFCQVITSLFKFFRFSKLKRDRFLAIAIIYLGVDKTVVIQHNLVSQSSLKQ